MPLLGSPPPAPSTASALLDALTGGWYGYGGRQRHKADQAAAQQGLLAAMPTPDSYAPPQYAPPVGEDGVPLDDPMARIPQATRFATWATDFARAGGDMGKVTDLYNATRTKTSVDAESGAILTEDGRTLDRLPRAEYLHGFRIEPYSDNAPNFVPTLPTGMQPDGKGGVANLPQLPQALGQQQEAERLGQTRGSMLNVPSQDGRTNMMTGGQYLDRGQGLVPGLGATQSPADRIREEGAASDDVGRVKALRDRVSAGERQLQTLDNMERLLPNVITGFGADARLQAERAIAGMSPTANARVAATQTFQNEARQLVSDIIKSFGANPTEGERKYAEQMAGADVAVTPESLRMGIKLRRERIERDKGELSAAERRLKQGVASPSRTGGPAVRTQGAGFKIIAVE